MGIVEYCKGLCTIHISVDIYISVEGFKICENHVIMTNLASIIYA